MSSVESFHAGPAMLLEVFLKAAISLKDQVVDVTWRGGGGRCLDPTAYGGLLGTAILCLRSYEATGSMEDLQLCAEIVDVCSAAALNSSKSGLTFLCGRAGIYAVGAVAANYANEPQRRKIFLDLFIEVANEPALPVGPDQGGFGMPYSLLHGRAGFLYAALFINKHLGAGTIPDDLLLPVVDAVLAAGRAGALNIPACPLMYTWHWTRYWGAAHGLAGILNVLMQFQIEGEDKEDVRGTLRYMLGRRGQSGNYPTSEGNRKDPLVQWSHGAGGVTIMLCKAAQVFPDDRLFYDAAVEAGEVVWKQGLNKKAGLSDGIAGNAYVFLSLFRLTGERIYLERAKEFAGFLYDNAGKLVADGGENSHSLFHGLAGVACLWFDMISPESARFPGFEL